MLNKLVQFDTLLRDFIALLECGRDAGQVVDLASAPTVNIFEWVLKLFSRFPHVIVQESILVAVVQHETGDVTVIIVGKIVIFIFVEHIGCSSVALIDSVFLVHHAA